MEGFLETVHGTDATCDRASGERLDMHSVLLFSPLLPCRSGFGFRTRPASAPSLSRSDWSSASAACPIGSCGKSRALFENIGTVQDGITTLAQSQDVTDDPKAKPLEVTKGEIVFDHVRFHYGKTRSVIEDLSMVIKPGEKVGLVGRSGAGKSTIVNLLLRFYDIEGGRILIDGQDIATVTQESLRAAIGMVTQDTSLLHRSVRENILYGRPDAGEEAMRAAAAKAEAEAFIGELTDPSGRAGYDAHVGERGVKLSGGQRQRIAIARVLLEGCADPPSGRGDVGARLRGGSGDPAEPLSSDGRQNRDRNRPPPLDDRRDGSPDRT